MIHKNVQMMDAGCVLFQTEKPYGIVLGGVKREMEKFGKTAICSWIGLPGIVCAALHVRWKTPE